MINDDALFRAQIESLDKTLDEEFGSVFDEDVPAGAAPAIKQPLESFAAAAAVKLGTRFEAEDSEVEHLKKETSESHWQHDDANIQDDSAADRNEDRKPPLLPQKKTYQSIIGCNNTGLFVKKQEIEKKDKKKPTYDSKDIPKVHTFSFFLLSLLVQRLNCLIFTSPPSKLPTKEEFSP